MLGKGRVKRFLDYLARRRASLFADDAHQWHADCRKVLDLCERALHERDLPGGDIGVVLDEADRTLFHLRGPMGNVRRTLRRDHSHLSRRVAQASDRLFHLRNLTSRFLIYSQGPGATVAGEGAIDAQARETYYMNALDSAGFEARRIRAEVAQELSDIWMEIRTILAQSGRAEG
jgi:hypothetical protein